MGLFDSKEEKEEKKMRKYMEKYHLDNISEKDSEIIKEISSEMGGFAHTMGMITNTTDQAKLIHLNTLIKQNWLLLRKLNEISDKLDQ